MNTSDARRMKELEKEYARLKKLLADRSLDKLMLQDVLTKFLRSTDKRETARYLQERLR